MSLTTRCPACSTRFRVVPDQLKISDGWVRCGHCSNVFDATLHLSASLMLSPAPAEAVAGPVLPPNPGPAIAPVPAPSPAPVPEPDPTPEPSPADNPISDFHAALQAFASQSGPPALDVDLSSQLPGQPAAGDVTEPSVDAPPADPLPPPAEDDAPAEIPGFVRQARRQAFWRSTPMRAVLLLTVLLLGGLLAAQWAFHQRSWLAARHPALKPLLVQACEPLGCSVEPLRRIDAIVIESATLVRRLGQFHSFDIVLQNTGDLPLAAPALELSLTDVGDRVIARRVFLPSEWPEAVTELPPRATVPVSFRLSIASSDDLPMAGYRALVFYP
ncbi:zinc-ribbon and DUF3426 domain-containing protein [Hydrogenophaga sp. IBVHS2]|uniref:zinc-ribbon and DUF3426 domain-containing protein n=1 Tax=Hydrogenophaga sp. IBVHS2 TaxID=1985170 RepID=UPI000A2D6A17|nr:zinc-ribbon and DUF3426 domain-containing protein [Hydrogenophaga sp. IBVHS2]OSZ64727.1 hypothetical protein CAP38_10020 [Hydrogenophaga sp. IBVHS2]